MRVLQSTGDKSDNTLEKLGALLQDLLLSRKGDSSGSSDLLSPKLKESEDLIKTGIARCSGTLNKFSLDGQVALVTGGGGGIGQAICHALGEAGCKVAVVDLSSKAAESVSSELKQKGIESIALETDVSKKDQVERMVASVIETFGDLHIAVNNAGIVSGSKAESTPEEEWRAQLDVNLSGVFFCCQAEARHMLGKGRGRIINTGSMSAQIVNRPQTIAAYNTSKAGVVHLTKSLAAEWAGRGVTVNSISPGYIDTQFGKNGPNGRSPEEIAQVKKQWLKDIPMGRMGEADEVVGGVLYLASSLASYTTGHDLVMDGGYTLW